MFIPKIYALNAQLGIVRSNRKEYTLEDGYFTPSSFEDFYFFIKQGFLLEGDPSIIANLEPIKFGTTQADVLKTLAENKGVNVIDANSEAEFKDECYRTFFQDVDEKIAIGEMAGQPDYIAELAEDFYQTK